MNQQIHKCSKKQKKAARAAAGCLMLLLLYGCAGQNRNAGAVTFVQKAGQEDAAQAGQAEGVADGEQEDVLTADTADAAADGAASGEGASPELYAVYVCGAVENPGVYELAAGSRVYEAVALAGGLTPEASETAVNQAELLSDGQMLRIPTEEEAALLAGEGDAALPAGMSGEADDGLVNINTADLEELKTLPGIGDAKAQSIIDYREKNGAFETIGDIKKIEGIKEGVFARLEGLIKAE